MWFRLLYYCIEYYLILPIEHFTILQGGQNDLHMECINRGQEFWDNCVQRAEHFITTWILPEPLARWYTRSNKLHAIAFDTPGWMENVAVRVLRKFIVTEKITQQKVYDWLRQRGLLYWMVSLKLKLLQVGNGIAQTAESSQSSLIGTNNIIFTLLKMRSSGNPKSGVPITGQIKLPLDGHSNSTGQ